MSEAERAFGKPPNMTPEEVALACDQHDRPVGDAEALAIAKFMTQWSMNKDGLLWKPAFYSRDVTHADFHFAAMKLARHVLQTLPGLVDQEMAVIQSAVDEARLQVPKDVGKLLDNPYPTEFWKPKD